MEREKKNAIIYTAPPPRFPCPPREQERAALAARVRRVLSWWFDRRIGGDGEVAVLREGAHEQGGVDQGGGPAAGRVHQGAWGGVLALAAQGGGAATVRQELPPPMDELPQARPQARQLHRRRGRAHHPPPQPPRQQVVSDRRAAAGQDGQRDQELLEHAHQAQAPRPRHRPADAPPAAQRQPRRSQQRGAAAAHRRPDEGGRGVRRDEAAGAGRVLRRRRRQQQQQQRDEHGGAAVPRPQPRPVCGASAELAAGLPVLPPRLPRRGGVQLSG